MEPGALTDQRDPVQLYCLRQARRRWIVLGVVVLALMAVGYWYVYLI